MIPAKEWRRAIGFALFVVVLTTIPYGLAFNADTTNDDGSFGGALFGVEDANSYLSKMRLGARGEFLFRLVYTPESTTPEALVFLPYIAVGQLVGALVSDDLQLPRALMIAFQVMRIAADLIYILVLYRFIAQFINSPRTRYHALILATLAGGLGWLTVLFPLGAQAMPDLTIPEGFSFLIVYGLPHLALARAALLLGLINLIPTPIDQGRLQWRVVGAGVLFNIVGLCVPFYLAVIYVLCGVWGLTAWIIQRRFPRALALRAIAVCALTLPLFAYNVYIFTTNPAFAQWSAQNSLRSPPLWEYVLAYALLVGLAFPAFRLIIRRARGRIEYALIIGWLIAAPILVYLPINVQRRLSEGVIVPLAICAALGVRRMLLSRETRAGQISSPRANVQRWVARIVIAFMCLTSVFWLATGVLSAYFPGEPTFQPTSIIRAFEWLQVNATPNTRVLASWETGNLLPVYTDLRPYVGLGPETLYAKPKEAQTWRFYADEMTPDERAAFFSSTCTDQWLRPFMNDRNLPVLRQVADMDNCAIQYVIYGDNEWFNADGSQNQRSAFDLDWMNALTLVYDENGVQIYAVP